LIGLIWAVGLLGWGTEAAASNLCRDIQGQSVCIETIKRSAKYVWEYRVVAVVDGKRQAQKRYDCRSLAISTAETVASFEAVMQQFVCGLVNHR
jgi:hypothetical protein